MDEKQHTWDAMTDGERDAWIAEQVMGYETGLMPSGTMQMWDVSGICEDIPRYTRDLNAAWLVIEQLGKHPGFDAFEIESHLSYPFLEDRPPEIRHTVRLTWIREPGGRPSLCSLVNIKRDALAEAICRAAWHALQEIRE